MVWSWHDDVFTTSSLVTRMTASTVKDSWLVHQRANWLTLLYRFVYDVCPRCPLHWLPVQHRIQYKIAVITTKTLSTSVPPYNDELLQQQVMTRSLWSTDAPPSLCAWTCTETTKRVLCASVTNVWNWLPNEIRNTNSPSRHETDKVHSLVAIGMLEMTYKRACWWI